MDNRVLIFTGVLVPFLMSSFSMFSIVYLFHDLANAFHVSIASLSVLVTPSFISGAVGGVVLVHMVDVLGYWF